jgi:hypothetical protein
MLAKFLRAIVIEAVAVAMELLISDWYRHASHAGLISPRQDTGGVAKDAGTSPKRVQLSRNLMQISVGSGFLCAQPQDNRVTIYSHADSQDQIMLLPMKFGFVC